MFGLLCTLFGYFWSIWSFFAAIFFTLSVATFLIPFFIQKALPEQDLKKKYAAKWALITGGSSGIGLSIANKLAKQGINLIIAAVKDDALDQSVKQLQKEYPSIQVIKVGTDLSKDSCLDDIKAETKKKDVQIVFCNAGYIKTGFFDDTTENVTMSNYHCNATSATRIAHHFIREMKVENLPGCVCFTSSPAGFMPTPFSAMYGATKAYLTELAQSIAPEAKGLGIDVAVCHPSPVKSKFYDGTHSIDMLEMFKNTGTTPDTPASYMLSCIGRFVVIDQGYYCAMARFILKVVDIIFMTELITRIAQHLPDYKNMRQPEKKHK